MAFLIRNVYMHGMCVRVSKSEHITFVWIHIEYSFGSSSSHFIQCVWKIRANSFFFHQYPNTHWMPYHFAALTRSNDSCINSWILREKIFLSRKLLLFRKENWFCQTIGIQFQWIFTIQNSSFYIFHSSKNHPSQTTPLSIYMFSYLFRGVYIHSNLFALCIRFRLERNFGTIIDSFQSICMWNALNQSNRLKIAKPKSPISSKTSSIFN